MNLIELGVRFKELRRASGDSQDSVAKRTGIDRTTVAKFETGGLSELGASKVERLFQLYGLSLEPVPVRRRPTLDDLRASRERTDKSV